jgi:hypothetical protein
MQPTCSVQAAPQAALLHAVHTAGLYIYRFTERDGGKGPPARIKTRTKRMQSEAKPRTLHPHTGRMECLNSGEGRARPRIGVRPAARVAKYAPEQHEDAWPLQRAMLSSRSAPPIDCGAIAHTRHKARLRNAKQCRTKTRGQGIYNVTVSFPAGWPFLPSLSVIYTLYRLRETRKKRPASWKQNCASIYLVPRGLSPCGRQCCSFSCLSL